MTAGATSTHAPITSTPLGSPLYRLPCGCEIDTNGDAPVLRHSTTCGSAQLLLDGVQNAHTALAENPPSEEAIAAARSALDHALSLMP